jgi:hypothetical protein
MKKEIKHVYVSAPITGMEDTAEERFSRAVNVVRQNGDVAINPWQENKSFSRWGDAIVAGLRLLKKCDAILLCEGWQNSRGCKIEQQFAQGAGIEVLFEESLKTE